MRLSLRLFAGLRERAGRERLELEDLPEPLDVAGLKAVLEERHAELGPLGGVRGVIGTRYVPETEALSDGQEVSLIPPVSGGNAGAELERGVFELFAEPLDPLAAQERVTDPSCGAVVLFTGMTREVNRGFEVVQLDYEAFEEMAATEMRRIYDDCLARFGSASVEGDEEKLARRLRMLTWHRTGTVGVGEPSVVIAVASPHRDAAFLAARFLIDELKKHVPLWKREAYRDGHHWIGERS